MLLKLMCSGGDYGKSLRRRRLVAFAFLALGILGTVCYFLLVDKSETLPDYAKGFYLGASSGICLGSVFLLVRTQYLITHPDARKKAQIQETDERERTIIAQSFQFAGYFTFFLCVAAMLVLMAVNFTAAITILFVVVVYALSWVCAIVYLSKKL